MKSTPVDSKLTRRRFLALTGLAVAAPTLIPSRVLGRGGEVAPSNRITMGVVGWGMQGPGNTRAFLGHANCQVVASCNIHKQHLKASLDTINGHYKNQDCKAYSDYREMMARKDIDTVMLAVPDNWHALIAVEAANQKKDIYGEKPLARTIAEQQAIVKAVQRNRRIWQTGSWQRSERNFHYGAEIARNGLLGKLKRVEVGLPSGHHDFAGTSRALIEKLASLPEKPTDLSKIVPGTPAWDLAVTPPPADLDYDMWIGPSQMEPHIEARVFMNWRWNYNVGGGQLLDWIGHHCDIAHWGMDCDNSGPIEIEGIGVFPPKNALWNTCTKYRITLKYPNDVEMIIAGGHGDIRSGTKWIGTDGWAWVDRGNAFESSNPDFVERRRLPEDARKVKLYESNDHYGNFLDCVKTRKPTITPVETAHHSAIPGHLGLIAMLTGRKIKWDAKREVIVGDKAASKLLTREYRKPWKLAGV
ncbi:MAG TPA: Gfo/Idh/MocA family oxidoreductase [Verrucomicrobiae bacterium]